MSKQEKQLFSVLYLYIFAFLQHVYPNEIVTKIYNFRVCCLFLYNGGITSSTTSEVPCWSLCIYYMFLLISMFSNKRVIDRLL